MSGNFEFLKHKDPGLYKLISEGERKIKTDMKSAASTLRTAFEDFIHSIHESDSRSLSAAMAERGLEYAPDMATWVKLLSDAEFINNHSLRIKPLVTRSLGEGEKTNYIYYRLPNLGPIKREYANADLKYRLKTNADTVRLVCNSFLHVGSEDKVLAKSYGNLLDGYAKFHELLRDRYAPTGGVPEFNPCLIPFGDYEIVKHCIPSDSPRSKCLHEYLAKSVDSDGEDKWAIIREYIRNTVDEEFIKRTYKTKKTAYSGVGGIPAGMPQIEELIKYGQTELPFYTIAYVFNSRPYALAEKLGELSDTDRYNICLSIAECFKNLHNSPRPIYHRLLNFGCIYLCNYPASECEWLPAVTNFNYAKINDAGVATVIGQVTTAANKLSKYEQKYIAPEWSEDLSEKDWEKVDIYAMGALFADILSGKLLLKVDEFGQDDSVIGKGYDNIVELITDMVDDDVKKRPSAKKVYKTILKDRD